MAYPPEAYVCHGCKEIFTPDAFEALQTWEDRVLEKVIAGILWVIKMIMLLASEVQDD